MIVFTDLPLPNTKRSRWGAGITADEMTEMRWVRLKFVVQIRFVEWTDDGHLRHAAFLGARFDKHPRDVHRE
jgi:bifunctional non-homologous end joining protein LigD